MPLVGQNLEGVLPTQLLLVPMLMFSVPCTIRTINILEAECAAQSGRQKRGQLLRTPDPNGREHRLRKQASGPLTKDMPSRAHLQQHSKCARGRSSWANMLLRPHFDLPLKLPLLNEVQLRRSRCDENGQKKTPVGPVDLPAEPRKPTVRSRRQRQTTIS